MSFGLTISRFLIPVILIVLLWNIRYLRKSKSIRWTLNRALPYLIFIVILFSRDFFSPNYCWPIAERQLSLIVFLIIFSIINVYSIRLSFEKVSLFFIAGILFSFIINILFAINASIKLSEGQIIFDPILSTITSDFLEASIYGGNFFMGDIFSQFLHPTYLAMYLTLGIFLIMKNSLIHRNLRVLLIIIFILYVFLVSSKAGIISLFLPFLVFAFHKFYQTNKRKHFLFSFIILLVLATIVIVHPRTSNVFRFFTDQEILIDKNAQYSNGTRLLVWYSSLKVIKNDPFFGVGPSQSEAELMETYQLYGFKYPYEKRYNAHNQYLQVLIAFGVLGFISFIWVLLRPVSIEAKVNMQFYVAFVLILSFNFLFESVLERYEGIVFFAFFYPYLAIYSAPFNSESKEAYAE